MAKEDEPKEDEPKEDEPKRFRAVRSRILRGVNEWRLIRKSMRST